MLLVGKNRQMPVKMVLNPRELRSVLEETRWKILQALAEEASYPAALAKKLKMDEQKVYYHINQLRKAGVVTVERTEDRRGATARYFKATDPAFSIVLKDTWKQNPQQSVSTPAFLEDFFSNGVLDAKIIVGSPDPHGPHDARARDGYFATDLALYLGSLSSKVKPSVFTDTQIRQKDLEDNNLIIVGGPVTNLVMARVNEDMPLQLKSGERWAVHSKNSGVNYYEDAGLVVKMQNPFNKKKKALVLAGSSIEGTKAAIMAVMLHSDEFSTGAEAAHVVEGRDLDGDGIIDDAKIVE